jgi:anti-sigma factor RsiW
MSAHPDKLPLIHGLLDGELDAANTLAIETHLNSCAGCRTEMDRIQNVRDRIAAVSLRDAAPKGLRTRIEAMIDAEAGAPPVDRAASYAPKSGVAGHFLNRRWISGALSGALAASLALIIAMPQLTQTGTEDQLIQSHVRSLMVGHVVDVETSNRHVVKPWFNGKVDFAPPVPELAPQGFPLVGGRLDYIDSHEVAAIVYRRGGHTINLFVRPEGTLSSPVGFTNRRDGYTLTRWAAGGLDYWAVSDLDPHDLSLFTRYYREQTGG